MQPRFEGLDRFVYSGGLVEHFSRSAPDHRKPAGTAVLFEGADVVHDALGLIHFGAGRLHVRPVNALHKFFVEISRHRLYGLERLTHLAEHLGFKHLGVDCGFVTVVVENVPAAKCQVVDPGQRDEIFNFRTVVVRALTETNRAQLRYGADRLGEVPLDRLDSGNQRGADRAEPGNQHS